MSLNIAWGNNKKFCSCDFWCVDFWVVTTSNHNKLLEKEKESSPEQEEKVLIAKSQPLQSQGLAINPEPSIPQNPNPPKEEEIQHFEISCEDDLFDDFG